MNKNTVFSKNLRFYMDARGKKQADLCKYLNVSSATVSDWCNGKKMPQTQRIGDIAAWLNIQVTDLFDESEPNENKVTIVADDDLAHFLELYQNATPQARAFARVLLESGKPQDVPPMTPPDTTL